MADVEMTVSSLKLKGLTTGSGTDRKATYTLEFDAEDSKQNVTSYKISIPDTKMDALHRALIEIEAELRLDDALLALIEANDFEIDLQ